VGAATQVTSELRSSHVVVLNQLRDIQPSRTALFAVPLMVRLIRSSVLGEAVHHLAMGIAKLVK